MAASEPQGRAARLDSRQQMEQHLRRKATTDAQFRQALLANPQLAIAVECGMTFPKTVTIHIHEETPTDLHLVIPPPLVSSDELSDEEVEVLEFWLHSTQRLVLTST